MTSAGLLISGRTTALRRGASDVIPGTVKGVASARSARPPLPCLNSNNSIQHPEETTQGTVNLLTPYHRRMAFVLTWEVWDLAEQFGLGHVGLLTLTFADNVQTMGEAQRRFNSLNSNVLSKRYRRAVVTWERQKSGRLHAHLLVVTHADIRKGIDFVALGRRDYRSANPALRAEWAFWRKTAPEYRFGRTELLPIKSNVAGIAKYVGKYIGKHVGQRKTSDKGRRLLRFLGYKPGDRRASCKFAWASKNAWLWRQKVKAFADMVGAEDLVALRRMFGRRWAYHMQGAILSMEIGGEAVNQKGGVSGYHPDNQNPF